METLWRRFSRRESKGVESQEKKIKGTMVLMKKNVLDCNDCRASCLDRLMELFGRRVSLQLISATHADDQENGLRGKLGKPTYLEKWFTTVAPSAAGEIELGIAFEWDDSMGRPGAFLITNCHHTQFFLKSFTLDSPGVPGHDQIHFLCNSWVYPAHRYQYSRVFFANKAYLPCATPEPLRRYRDEELANLRGNGSGTLMEWDRVYDYAYYNDLGTPDKGPEYARPVLGGSEQYPYPRRGRTGRKPTKNDSNSESRLPLLSLNIYVPRDERFGHLKFCDFLDSAFKSVIQVMFAAFKSLFNKTIKEFDSFEKVMNLYGRGNNLQNGPARDREEPGRTDGGRFLKFPMPDVIKEDQRAWRTDEEFAREMLAGVNPVVIRRLQEFPPASKLNPKKHGDQRSRITREQIENNMDGLTVDQAMEYNRLFILDYHDTLMPYLKRINSTPSKVYASRTLLLLINNGTLKPLAIELSLPHPDGDQHGAVSRVFTPSAEGVEGSIWLLAKAYAAVNDSGYHQLISHWLQTHAAIEPFVIATNRQLSVLHPIHKLLHPHFRDTMYINALARQILINASGVLEKTVFPAKFSMEMSAVVYKTWNFAEQALPVDLQKRGMAVPDQSCRHGLRLLIEDYPYAVDGLEIWSAIETWVIDYCSFYYPEDDLVSGDSELQSWWWEVRNVGHGDKKDEPWWPELQTRADLIQTCTIIIWVASALHAAVNFGQYPYAGFLPNRPTISRRFMPEVGTEEYRELESDPERAYLMSITSHLQTLLGISLIEILSRHSQDEIYLGHPEGPNWTADGDVVKAFGKFRARLMEMEGLIKDMNGNESLKNRRGPVKVPYTLLYPSTSDPAGAAGLTGKGIPNSVSI